MAGPGVSVVLYSILAMVQQHKRTDLLLGITAFLVAALSSGWAIAHYINTGTILAWYDPLNAFATVAIAAVGVATARHIWRP